MPRVKQWDKAAWDALLLPIEKGRCTPFLGAGASTGVLPSAGDLARELAQYYNYPFTDSHDLARVAQFAAIQGNPATVKAQVSSLLKDRGKPNFDDPNEPHRAAAELGLPVYITTNYDDFMTSALAHVGRKPRQVVCRWYEERRRQQGAPYEPVPPSDEWLDATPEQPVVFHFHGSWDRDDSLVLTEDDYLDFLIYAHGTIPARIEQAFTDSSLLFLGYSFSDLNFKVLFRKVASHLRLNVGRLHAAVQLDPAGKRGAERQRRYLEGQFGQMSIRIFWGTFDEFIPELRKQLEKRRELRPRREVASHV